MSDKHTAAPATLIAAGALRQFKHSNDSDSFVFGYDKQITDREFARLEAKAFPNFASDGELIAYLDKLHVCDENGTASNLKWPAAQQSGEAGLAGFAELLRGLECGPAIATWPPHALFALGQSIAAQAKLGNLTAQSSATPSATAEVDEYTCIGKGGVYELVGTAKGAGTSKLIEDLIVYRDSATGELYYRTAIDFDRRMEKVAATKPGEPTA